MRLLHIGYGDSATGCILEAINNYGLIGDGAVPSRDDFTQGSISDCMSSSGIQQRISYWKSVESILNFGMEVNDFYLKSIRLLEEIDADQMTIWVGDSCHDILATGWLLSFLKEKNIQWFIVNLAEIEPFDMPNQTPVVNLAMYTPGQLSNLWKYRKELTIEEMENYISTFKKACEENSPYRIKDKTGIVSVGGDYFDAYILSHITYDFEPVKTVIGRILRDGTMRISDTTVEVNIKKMINRSIIESINDSHSKSSYSIRK